MYFPRFAIVKLTFMSNKMFLYIENKHSTSTEVIGCILHTKVSNYNIKSQILKWLMSIL